MKPSETKDENMQRADTQSPLRCSSPASTSQTTVGKSSKRWEARDIDRGCLALVRQCRKKKRKYTGDGERKRPCSGLVKIVAKPRRTKTRVPAVDTACVGC